MGGIRFCPVSAARARGIVAGRAKLRSAAEARLQLRAWIEKWAFKHPKLCAWVEGNIEQTWTFYRSPHEHHKHLKSTKLLGRLNQEIKRRTHVVRIFPDEASCLRLIRALACEPHEEWLDGPVYLDMQPLCESIKASLQLSAGMFPPNRNQALHKPHENSPAPARHQPNLFAEP